MKRRSLLGGGLAAAATMQARPPAATPVAGRYDVVVCGGGTAGLPAALAAARRGAKVAIVERYGFLGGNPATSIMPAWHGLRDHHTGMLTEFARRVKDFGLGPDPLATASLIEPEAVKILFLKMALEAKVDLHLHTFLCGVEKSGARVARIVTESKSGRRAFEAKTFIDATGDGDAGYLAGAKCLKGDNGKMQGMALRFRIGYVDNARYLAWAAQNLRYYRGAQEQQLLALREKALGGEPFHVGSDLSEIWNDDPDPELPRNTYFVTSSIRPNELSVNATRVYDLDGTRAEDLTKAEILTRLQAFAIWRYLKKNIPGFERSAVVETAPQVGVRESRAVVGDYVVSTEDFLAGRQFPDSVLTCRVVFDSHDKGKYDTRSLRGGLVDIPYRCFLPAGVDGLLVAGRCLSSDHLANSAVRRMESAFQTGEVAGTAAFLALEKGVAPRKLPVEALQAELRRAGFHTSQAARKAASA